MNLIQPANKLTHNGTWRPCTLQLPISKPSPWNANVVSLLFPILKELPQNTPLNWDSTGPKLNMGNDYTPMPLMLPEVSFTPPINNILFKPTCPAPPKVRLPSFESSYSLLDPPGEGTHPLQAIPILSSNKETKPPHSHNMSTTVDFRENTIQTLSNKERSPNNDPKHCPFTTRKQTFHTEAPASTNSILPHLLMDATKTLPYKLPSAPTTSHIHQLEKNIRYTNKTEYP